jgi:lipopolysaccharide transport system permease protein
VSTGPFRPGPIDLLLPVLPLVRWRVALRQFLVRAVARRYRVSVFGFLWTAFVPLFTLGIYTFVFGTVMRSRWDTGAAAGLPFSLQLFAGLIVFWLMADAVTQAPTAIVEHANLVKKAVFPLEVIPAVVVGSALFHTAINTAILLAAMLALGATVPLTALLFPLVLVPFVLMLVGLAWGLAALGVYFRDMAHIVGLLMTGLLFLSPVFYPLSRLSPALQKLVILNPVTVIVVAARQVLLEGVPPDWASLGVYLVAAWLVAAAGLAFFRAARRNFADVL